MGPSLRQSGIQLPHCKMFKNYYNSHLKSSDGYGNDKIGKNNSPICFMITICTI